MRNSLENAWFSFGIEEKIGFVVPDIDGDGKPLLIAIEKGVQMDRKPVNLITSAYGLDSPKLWIENQYSEGKELIVYNKKEADKFFQTYGYLAAVERNFQLHSGIVSQEAMESQEKNNSIPKRRKASSLVAPGRSDVVAELSELYRQEGILQEARGLGGVDADAFLEKTYAGVDRLADTDIESAEDELCTRYFPAILWQGAKKQLKVLPRKILKRLRI